MNAVAPEAGTLKRCPSASRKFERWTGVPQLIRRRRVPALSTKDELCYFSNQRDGLSAFSTG